MTGAKHISFAPVFFPKIHKSISKTEKWRFLDVIYKKAGEFSNFRSRHDLHNFCEANFL
jgi:hypothetical protein